MNDKTDDKTKRALPPHPKRVRRQAKLAAAAAAKRYEEYAEF